MKYRHLSLFTALVFTGILCTAQQTEVCDTVYDMAEAMPYFENGIQGTTEFTIKELAPVISECKKQGGEIDTRLLFTLTVNKQGKISEVANVKGIIPDKCKAQLAAKLLSMTGWVAGQTNGKPVCCHVILPITIEIR